MSSTRGFGGCLLSALLCGTAACSPAPKASVPTGEAPAATDRAQTPRPSPPARERAADAATREGRTGVATFIADRLHGRKTASGEPYDRNSLVAAHPTYPLGTVVQVTNQANGRMVEVKIVDRTARRNRNREAIDLSRAAAERLDFIQQGTAKVTMEVIARPSQ